MKKLAVIGGGYLQLPLILKCKEIGIETHCFSWEDGAICKDFADYFYPISIINKEEILIKCREIKVGAVLTIASDVAVITVNYIASRLGLISNPDEYTDITTNKYKMRMALSSKQCPCPLYKKISGYDSIDVSDMSFPLIVKPTDRSGSRGVTKVYNEIELTEAINRARQESFCSEVIVEEYIDGREVSVETISFEGKHYVLQITDKVTTGEPYFVELEHHQPSTLSDKMKSEIKNVVINSLNALHIKYGASHSELKISKDGKIKIIEIGARMGGDFIGSDLVQLSTGYDYLKHVILASFGEFTEPEIKYSKHSGIYFLSKETEYLKKYFENSHDYSEIVRAEILDNNLHNIKESADRSGYFIYQSDTKPLFQ